jgi:hypothetical protein
MISLTYKCHLLSVSAQSGTHKKDRGGCLAARGAGGRIRESSSQSPWPISHLRHFSVLHTVASDNKAAGMLFGARLQVFLFQTNHARQKKG